MRNVTSVLLAVVTAISAASAHADQRIDYLVDEFISLCANNVPNFSQINEIARRRNWELLQEKTTPNMPLGESSIAKYWRIDTTKGNYKIDAGEVILKTRHITSCTISAEDAHGNEVKRRIGERMNIYSGSYNTLTSEDGKRLTTFFGVRGFEHPDRMSVQLSQPTSDGPGFQLAISRVIFK